MGNGYGNKGGRQATAATIAMMMATTWAMAIATRWQAMMRAMARVARVMAMATRVASTQLQRQWQWGRGWHKGHSCSHHNQKQRCDKCLGFCYLVE